jgi:GT2 family glycosyltransferase
MRQLAPIAIFLYNRPDHAQRTLDSLGKNVLADNSDLFIFSDAAKDESAQKQVEQVRQFAKTVTGFKRIEIIERTTNVGLANSIINGVTQLVNQYGKVIVFEDDLVSSPYTFNILMMRSTGMLTNPR